MDEAGPVLGGDEVAGEDRGAAGPAVREGERRALVVAPDQLGAGDRAEQLRALAEHALDQRLGQDQDLAVDRDAGVADGGRDRDGDVAGQRPRRRGPDQQVFGLPARLLSGGDERKLYVDRRVLHVLVALGHLVGGERGAAARAVGDDLVPLVEVPGVPEPAQRPPDRLDVGVLQRHVGVVEVDPEADAFGQPVPLLDVLEDRFPAALVELGDPVGLDLLLGGDAELFFDLELDRQPVAVPARLARHPVAAHRLVARVDVLEDAREDVVGAGAAVRGRRPLVEAPDLGALAVLQRALEDVVLAPVAQHALLQLGEGLLGVHLLETGHERRILGARYTLPR